MGTVLIIVQYTFDKRINIIVHQFYRKIFKISEPVFQNFDANIHRLETESHAKYSELKGRMQPCKTETTYSHN